MTIDEPTQANVVPIRLRRRSFDYCPKPEDCGIDDDHPLMRVIATHLFAATEIAVAIGMPLEQITSMLWEHFHESGKDAARRQKESKQ